MSEPSPRVGSRKAALTVPCHVSERWLRFEEREQFEVLDEDLIQLDVMTRDDDGEPYKLCELVVARGDLLRAVAAYGDPPLRTTPVRRKDVEPADTSAEPSPARRRRRAESGQDQPQLGEP
ncbi:MAG: hypothetical protein KFH98_14010 [Gemmatimonadetes bacterium]|nr:hypothetical protein [Gemmatimonadota bacterium]